jgi:hypothetical protein
MADNSVALGRSSGPDFFADDDPLAELARIAGFDERPGSRPYDAAPVRREPAFNLEDELLHELEQFDSPNLDPIADIPVAPLLPVAARTAPVAPPVERDPFADDEPAAPRSEPLFTARPAAPEIQAPVRPASSDLPGLSADRHPIPVAAAAPRGGFDMDLISELEGSLAAPAVSPAPKAGRPPARAYEPGFRMPIANFNLAQTRVEPGMTASAAAVASSVMPESPALAAQLSSAVQSLGPMVEPVAAPVQAPPVSADAWEGDFDLGAAMEAELSVDQPAQVAPVQPVAERRDPVAPSVPAAVEAAPAEAAFSAQQQPVYDVDHYSVSQRPAPMSAPVIAERSAVVSASQPAPPVVAVAPQPATLDAADDEFELALDDLELDFSDLMVDEPMATAPVSKPLAAPSVAVQQPAPFVASVSPAVPPFLAAARSVAPVAAATAPVVAAAVVEHQVVPDPFALDSDAFDPALLAEAEEMPEAVADLNVPEIPVHEPEQPVAPQHDYDLDLDAELASFLETALPAAAAASAPAAQPARAAAQPSVTENKSFNDGLDEFERALEEDFRRSLSTPLMRKTLDEQVETDDVYAAPRRSLGSWMMPLSVAGFVGIAGLSFYAWYASDGGRLGGDGAPVVIAADTDPVKVVPQNPGGKTVPNQDKAVYDRVASGALGDPKQAALISSDEQPVDVVQKTLVPESFSLEGEDEAQESVTQVADTQDPRLMPDQVEAAGKPGEQDQLAVMPRRVKTMIVRPDGTLVEQVSEVPAATAALRTEKMPAAPTLGEPTQTASTSQIATVSDHPATQLSDVNVAKTTALTDAAAPVATAGTTTPKGTPVPSARPSEQPVRVVAAVSEQGNLQTSTRPTAPTPVAPAAAAPATVQTASIQPQKAASSAAGGYYIQIASLPSEADAQKSYRNLSSKFSGVIGGRGVDIARADVAGKGTFYRVRIPAGSKDEAAVMCEKYRSAGGTCLIAR